MEQRKIIKFGNSSYVITLPQEWMDENNLKKGDEINVVEGKNSLILTAGGIRKERNIGRISIDNKPLKLFNKEFLSFYLKNYKVIEIVGESVLDRLEEIKKFKNKISSVEITEISKNKVVLRDLTSPSKLDFSQLLKEIIDMEKLFFQQLCEENLSEKYFFLIEVDSNINKLSFLAYKNINFNLTSLSEFESVENSIHHWRIISNLEEVGDILKRVGRYIKNETKEHNHFISETICQIGKYFNFIVSLLDVEDEKFKVDLESYMDKKQNLLRDIEALRGKLKDDLNLYLVLSQLFKDLLGKLDNIVLSTIDLRN